LGTRAEPPHYPINMLQYFGMRRECPLPPSAEATTAVWESSKVCPVRSRFAVR
jgi:hypothetical protein